MEHKSFWGFEESGQTAFQETSGIFDIMNRQCDELAQYTKGYVFGIFDVIKKDESLAKTAGVLASIMSSISWMPDTSESIGEMSTKDKIDADTMYWQKRFAFEICTEKYRFRVFSMLITPVFPVTITINEGVCKNIANKLEKMVRPVKADNTFIIDDEDVFCGVLKEILSDRKVHYIVRELTKRGQAERNEKEGLPEKVIVCEGRTDEIVLNALAQKLNKKITIIASDGEYNVPAVFSSVKAKNAKTDVLIVVDSDGDENGVKESIEQRIGHEAYELAIINNCIEDWFSPGVRGFSKLKLMQTINAILDETNFDELATEHESFAKVVSFLQK